MIPINKNGNCENDLLGSGSRSCDIGTFGDVKGFNLHPKGWSLNLASDLTEDTWKEEIKNFNVIPYKDVYDFTQDTPDNEIATSSTGEESTLRLGKPHFSFNFDKGGCFHKSLFDKRGKNKWDVSLMFEEGILLPLNIAETKISGFNCGRFDVPTFKLQQAGDPQSSMAIMQFLDAVEFNSRWVFIKWSELGFSMLDLEGIVNLKITFTETPAAGDSELKVKVASACNSDDVIIDFDATTAWRLGGKQATTRTISAVTFDTESSEYTLTLDGALANGDTIQPTLKSTDGDVAEDDLGNFYKGKTVLTTISTVTT